RKEARVGLGRRSAAGLGGFAGSAFAGLYNGGRRPQRHLYGKMRVVPRQGRKREHPGRQENELEGPAFGGGTGHVRRSVDGNNRQGEGQDARVSQEPGRRWGQRASRLHSQLKMIGGMAG